MIYVVTNMHMMWCVSYILIASLRNLSRTSSLVLTEFSSSSVPNDDFALQEMTTLF